MQRSIFTPLLVFLGIVSLLLLMACSSIFTPLIRFLHAGEITVVQALACIIFAGAGFAACYSCLGMLCSYFVPRIEPEGQTGCQGQK